MSDPYTISPSRAVAPRKCKLIDLSLLIATINSWNRLAIGFRTHHPHDRVKAAA